MVAQYSGQYAALSRQRHEFDSRCDRLISGCGAIWQHTCFGNKGLQVQVLSFRLAGQTGVAPAQPHKLIYGSSNLPPAIIADKPIGQAARSYRVIDRFDSGICNYKIKDTGFYTCVFCNTKSSNTSLSFGMPSSRTLSNK